MQRLDDTDPRIHYAPSSAWGTFGSAPEYLQTTHITATSGGQMVFQFRGTKVEVYGTITSNAARIRNIAYFSVDDGDPQQWSASIQSQAMYNQKLYSSPDLPDGNHTLVMTNTVDNGETIIDYLEYMASTSTPSSSPSSLASTSTPGASLSVGAVAGISIAATLVVISVLLCLLWWCFVRRKRRCVHCGHHEAQAVQKNHGQPSIHTITPNTFLMTTQTTPMPPSLMTAASTPISSSKTRPSFQPRSSTTPSTSRSATPLSRSTTPGPHSPPPYFEDPV
ncbi:hypothetical protein V5O48_015626 [Marasmius crinis-equi]|uniref:Transmembrane protein n=1 Tax=Marasmius crinis-equi TaxID=585013 RepID=A0ABR3EU19_9AGAR